MTAKKPDRPKSAPQQQREFRTQHPEQAAAYDKMLQREVAKGSIKKGKK